MIRSAVIEIYSKFNLIKAQYKYFYPFIVAFKAAECK